MKISQAAEIRFAKFLKLTQQIVRDCHNAEEEKSKAYDELLAYQRTTQDSLRKILTMPEKDLSSEARYELLFLLIGREPTPGPELNLFLNKKGTQ
jgi:hypothetical protein